MTRWTHEKYLIIGGSVMLLPGGCIVMAPCLWVPGLLSPSPSPLCYWPGQASYGPGPEWPGRPGRGFARQWMILYSWMDCCELHWAAQRGERDRGETRGSVSASSYHWNIRTEYCGAATRRITARSDGDFECLDRVEWSEASFGTFVKVWLYVNTCSQNSVSWMKIWTFTSSD